MKSKLKNPFSGPVIVFHERRLPEKAKPVGYAALIEACELAVPFPVTMCQTDNRGGPAPGSRLPGTLRRRPGSRDEPGRNAGPTGAELNIVCSSKRRQAGKKAPKEGI